MRIETRIRIERHDLASAAKLDQAYNMVGGHDFPEEVQKVFGRIRGNDFALADVRAAAAAIRARAVEMRARAESAEVFLDPKLQATWAEGVRASAALGERLLDEFVSDLDQDIASAA